MEERLTQAEAADVFSTLRHHPSQLPEAQRLALPRNTRALPKLSDVFIETCDMWADDCKAEMKRFHSSMNDTWRRDVSEEVQGLRAWTNLLKKGLV